MVEAAIIIGRIWLAMILSYAAIALLAIGTRLVFWMTGRVKLTPMILKTIKTEHLVTRRLKSWMTATSSDLALDLRRDAARAATMKELDDARI
jgi:hypothetical protein